MSRTVSARSEHSILSGAVVFTGSRTRNRRSWLYPGNLGTLSFCLRRAAALGAGGFRIAFTKTSRAESCRSALQWSAAARIVRGQLESPSEVSERGPLRTQEIPEKIVRNEEAEGSNPFSSTNIFSKLNNLPNPAKFDQLGELGISRIFAFWKRKSHACSLCPS